MLAFSSVNIYLDCCEICYLIKSKTINMMQILYVICYWSQIAYEKALNLCEHSTIFQLDSTQVSINRFYDYS